MGNEIHAAPVLANGRGQRARCRPPRTPERSTSEVNGAYGRCESNSIVCGGGYDELEGSHESRIARSPTFAASGNGPSGTTSTTRTLSPAASSRYRTTNWWRRYLRSADEASATSVAESN